jgi:hypothetical protein
VRGNYYILLACPSCLRSTWVFLQNISPSRERLLNTFWKFQCPVHGLLREKPIQVQEKRATYGAKRAGNPEQLPGSYVPEPQGGLP